ncbi:MAG: SDR family NAD(P)-dependent oxidoreductase, partial [Verrucomicrobiaceae bacterium]
MAIPFSIAGCKALITGASSGLGAEFARQLATRASCLVLAARSGNKLEALADELVKLNAALRVVSVTCDLATDQGRDKLWESVDVLDVTPTLLINNAGLGDYGDFAAADEPRVRQQIDLNITALTLLTHGFLQRILDGAGQPGAILNVSSLAGATPMPDLAVYAA